MIKFNNKVDNKFKSGDIVSHSKHFPHCLFLLINEVNFTGTATLANFLSNQLDESFYSNEEIKSFEATMDDIISENSINEHSQLWFAVEMMNDSTPVRLCVLNTHRMFRSSKTITIEP